MLISLAQLWQFFFKSSHPLSLAELIGVWSLTHLRTHSSHPRVVLGCTRVVILALCPSSSRQRRSRGSVILALCPSSSRQRGSRNGWLTLDSPRRAGRITKCEKRMTGRGRRMRIRFGKSSSDKTAIICHNRCL